MSECQITHHYNPIVLTTRLKVYFLFFKEYSSALYNYPYAKKAASVKRAHNNHVPKILLNYSIFIKQSK